MIGGYSQDCEGGSGAGLFGGKSSERGNSTIALYYIGF